MRSLLLAGCLLAALIPAPPVRAGEEEPSLLRGGTAVPNFLGTTGMLLTPTARTVGDRGFSGFAFFGSDFNSYGLLAGPADRVEIGFAFLDPDDGGRFTGGDEVLLNAKLLLLRESRFLPGLAVGVTDAFDQLGADESWYAVASKDLGRMIPLGMLDWTLHLGYGGGIYDDQLFGGLEMRIGTPLDLVPLTRPTVSLLVEYADDDIHLGLRGRWRGLAATLGLLDLDRFTAGISYTAGLRL